MRKLQLLTLLFLLAFAPNDARKANQAYEQGDYARAAELYRQALQADPENPRLHFNLGNSLAEIGQLEEARLSYEQFKSLTDDPVQIALADYNIGNLMLEAEDLAAAAESFREALKNNPDDEDAKHNYELTLRQEQEHTPNPQPQSDDPESQDDDQEQDQDQSPQEEQPEQPPDPQEQQSDGTPEEQPADMSLDEAERVLDALQQRERELLRDREKPSSEESDDEKDW